ATARAPKQPPPESSPPQTSSKSSNFNPGATANCTTSIIFATFAISPRTNPAHANAARSRSSSARPPPKTTIRDRATERGSGRAGQRGARERARDIEYSFFLSLPRSLSPHLLLNFIAQILDMVPGGL